MSLLLDALRRAGRDREGGGRDEADSLELPDPAGTDPQRPASDRARAAAVVGRPPGLRLRTAALVGLGAVAVIALAGAGGWYYFHAASAEIRGSLSGYDPEREVAARPAAGNEGTGDAGEAGDDTAEEPSGSTLAASEGGGDGPTADSGEDAAGDAPDERADTTGAADEPAAAGEPATPDTESGEAGMGADATPGAKNGGAPVTDAPEQETAASPAPADVDADARADETARTADTAQPSPDDGSGATTARETAADGATGGGDTATARAGNGDPVVRSDPGSPVADALAAGYRAYRGGDFDAARRAYTRAVELAPANRDARLGAAAVAVAEGDLEAAERHYTRVVEQHPQDPYARAGLARLGRLADGADRGDALRATLRRHPRAHALRFELGNYHAGREQWSAARRAYAEALRIAPEEADYAYNLAVALDHLGRSSDARRAYERALDLAGQAPASFPVEAARRRLERMKR